MKVTSVPFYYFIFPTKKIYVGDKKKIKSALKYNCVLASNHRWMFDILFMSMHFFNQKVFIKLKGDSNIVKCW